MSAYMVDDVTVDRILGGALEHAPELIGRIPGDNFVQQGQALLRMNAEALRQRYGDDDRGAVLGAVQAEQYQGLVRIGVDAAQWCKSMHCFLYQCGEGAVPDSQLYQDLNAAAERYRFLVDAAEYKDAEWA